MGGRGFTVGFAGHKGIEAAKFNIVCVGVEIIIVHAQVGLVNVRVFEKMYHILNIIFLNHIEDIFHLADLEKPIAHIPAGAHRDAETEYKEYEEDWLGVLGVKIFESVHFGHPLGSIDRSAFAALSYNG
jgi:hypothetical protein